LLAHQGVGPNHKHLSAYQSKHPFTCQLSTCFFHVLTPLSRNFLLFLPTNVDSEVNLENILSYYSHTSTVRLGSESDVIIDAKENTGTDNVMSFIKPFFAIMFTLQRGPRQKKMQGVRSAVSESLAVPVHGPESRELQAVHFQPAPATTSSVLLVSQITAAEPAEPELLPGIDWSKWSNVKLVLIACVPSTGYFAAGAVAGIVSRTATAPLDRLKVYLIAQTKTPTQTPFGRHGLLGKTAAALKNTGFAIKDLWSAGGLRSLYAGTYCAPLKCVADCHAGNGLNIIKVMPETAIRFGFFEV
jgi:solute carrier family 25 (mitochondrial phosphate transporter), member 23/24/25/41